MYFKINFLSNSLHFYATINCTHVATNEHIEHIIKVKRKNGMNYYMVELTVNLHLHYLL